MPSSDTEAALSLDEHTPSQCPQDHVSQLPDEILDSIIRIAGPQHGTAATTTGSPEKRDWLSCAAVCRQWHRITLPHSFRYIRVTESHHSDHYKERTASNFLLFLQENPSIAPLIQEANFLRVTVSIQVLSSILDGLVNLKYLIFFFSFVEGNLDADPPTMDRKLDRLLHLHGGVCELIDCSPAACGRQLPQLLSLFSEVGELEDRPGCCYDHGLPSELEHTIPRIRSFDTTLDFNRYHSLQKLGIFNALTCLQVSLRWLSRLEFYGNDFLRLVGTVSTLRELYLAFTQRVDERSFPLRHQLPYSVANSIRDGLAACSSLHAFRLEMKAYITRAHLTTEENVRTIFPLCFLIGLEIITLLDPNQLKHISFRYDVGAYAHLCRSEDIYDLDWNKLQGLCRRFANLRSFTLDMFAEQKQKEMFRACAREKMAHFKDVMLYGEPGTFFRCDDPTCAWYSGSRLNEYITLHHDILKD